MALKASELEVGSTHTATLVEDLKRTQLVMYAGASGDYNPLHTDEVFAKEVAGYPTVFAHGMLTMGMTGKMLTTTLLPSDITPDTPYLVAPCESHPLYNVTGVEWLAKKFPDAKTAFIITTNDIEYGKQSAATYNAAFEVEVVVNGVPCSHDQRAGQAG